MEGTDKVYEMPKKKEPFPYVDYIWDGGPDEPADFICAFCDRGAAYYYVNSTDYEMSDGGDWAWVCPGCMEKLHKKKRFLDVMALKRVPELIKGWTYDVNWKYSEHMEPYEIQMEEAEEKKEKK